MNRDRLIVLVCLGPLRRFEDHLRSHYDFRLFMAHRPPYTLAAMTYRERYIGCRLIRYAMCGTVIFVDVESWRPRRYLPRS